MHIYLQTDDYMDASSQEHLGTACAFALPFIAHETMLEIGAPVSRSTFIAGSSESMCVERGR